jgi:hypothetical protein
MPFNTDIQMCSVCRRDPYYSSDFRTGNCRGCLSNDIQPYHGVLAFSHLGETSTRGFKNIKVLEHILSYANYLLGNHIPHKVYREREGGECIDNYVVDIGIFME